MTYIIVLIVHVQFHSCQGYCRQTCAKSTSVAVRSGWTAHWWTSTKCLGSVETCHLFLMEKTNIVVRWFVTDVTSFKYLDTYIRSPLFVGTNLKFYLLKVFYFSIFIIHCQHNNCCVCSYVGLYACFDVCKGNFQVCVIILDVYIVTLTCTLLRR